MKKQLSRQGDVIIERIDEIPAPAKRVKLKRGQRIILAYGEATGHHHSLDLKDADWWKHADDANGDQYLNVKTSAVVTHQEHAPVALPAGKYRVIQQREYSPEEIRRVRD
jgi:hypothetical protein